MTKYKLIHIATGWTPNSLFDRETEASIFVIENLSIIEKKLGLQNLNVEVDFDIIPIIGDNSK